MLFFPFSGGHSSCEFAECDPSPTANLVNFYAENHGVWIDVFSVAYDKMTSTVADGVKKSLRRPTKNE